MLQALHEIFFEGLSVLSRLNLASALVKQPRFKHVVYGKHWLYSSIIETIMGSGDSVIK